MTGHKLIMEHYYELLEILDCIKVGIYITDGSGKTLLLNKESEKTGGMSREELKGRNMKELIELGYVEESSVLKAMKSRTEESIIQKLGEGGQLYITGVPLIKNGKIELVVCTERDITETISLKELLIETEKIAEKYESELEYFRKKSLDNDGEIICESFEMKEVLEKAMRIAQLDTTVLLTGESGTGKELIANMIFKNSSRKEGSFIKINCAAVPENLLESEFFGYEKGAFTGADKNGKIGIFELAKGGTLFLDEIGDLPIKMQSKLLRVLQEREIFRIGGKENIPVDVRIIAATNVDLKNAIREGRFREDLYYRLNIIPIDIPSLRIRKSDIRQLTYHFVKKFNRLYKMEKIVSEDAVKVLENYDWPGNVRELSNVIERIMVGFDGPNITKFQVERQLPHDEATGEKRKRQYRGTLQEMMEQYEKDILADFLNQHSASEAARLLHVNKSTISRKIKKYGIGG